MKYLLIVFFCLSPVLSYAGVATDMAEDPVLEKRMMALAHNLRCLVCQNETLAASRSDLAEDMRREVREQMKKGLSDQQIKDYLVARYGDYVLYDPPVKSYTLLLWYGPFALLLIGLVSLVFQLRKRKSKIPEAQPSAKDAQRASAMLNPPKDL